MLLPIQNRADWAVGLSTFPGSIGFSFFFSFFIPILEAHKKKKPMYQSRQSGKKNIEHEVHVYTAINYTISVQTTAYFSK